jgi:hypothetical protein
MHLDGWAFDRTIGAKHATIAGLGSQHGMTVAAFVEEETGVSRHQFGFRKSAMRAGEHRFENSIFHGQLSR